MVGRSAGTIACNLSRMRLRPAPDVEHLDRNYGDSSPWTEDEQTFVAMLVDRGWSPTWVAKLLKRTPSSVQTQCSRLGIAGTRFPSKQKPKGKWRKCMCCGSGFSSEWIGNRICSPCKGTDLYRLAS